MRREEINTLMDEFKNNGGMVKKNMRIEIPKVKLSSTAFKSRFHSEDIIANVIKLCSGGALQYKIAEELKMSISTVSRILKARGLS